MSKKVEWLIAGLGNPGNKYAGNRHNIGWMVVTRLAERYKKPVMGMSRIYLQAAMRIDGNLTLAVMPTTYMNNSGEAVKSASELFDIPPEKILVICDEYNFSLGKIHLRQGGGDGGHNGVSSVIDWLDSIDFFRLRCGIDKDFGPGGMVDYVLRDFEEDETESRELMIEKAVDAIECMVRLGPGKAMSKINSGALWKPKEQEKPSGVKNSIEEAGDQHE